MKRAIGNWLRSLAGWIDPPEQFQAGTCWVKPDITYLGNAKEILDGLELW